MEDPTMRIPSDFVRKTPTSLAKGRAVVAFRRTVPSTTVNTRGVMYSAPGSPRAISLEPKREAIPAATIPRGPTQPIKSFSDSLRSEPWVLNRTMNGRIKKTIMAKSRAVFQL